MYARTGDSFAYLKVLQKAVNEIRNRFDYILIDTPPTFSILFTNSIFACDEVLIPTKMEFLSIRALGPLLKRIEEIKEHHSRLEVFGILGAIFRTKIKETNCLLRGCAKEGSRGAFENAYSPKCDASGIRFLR